MVAPGRWLTGAVAVAVLVVPLVSAQTSPPAPTVEERLQVIEKKIAELEKRVDEATRRLGAKPAEPIAGDRLQALEQHIRELERVRPQETSSAKTNPTTVAAGPEGFALKSADNSFQLKFGAYVQADGRTFFDDRNHSSTSTFLLRRARPVVQGTIYKYVDFRLMPDFGDGKAVIQDAYADLRYYSFAVLRGGKFKTPVGLELLQSDPDTLFTERALPNNLVPNRDLGFELYGDLASRISYAVGVFNGAADGSNLDADLNDGKDTVARIFATPFAKSSLTALKGLGFGIATSSGRQEGAVLPVFKSTGQATFFSYVSGAVAAGHRLRYSPQAYYYNGPFGLMAEYVASSQRVALANVAQDVSNHAWQLAGSWLITGEKKSYQGVTPKRNFEPSVRHGFGAWELAVRYSQLNVDPAAFALRFADPAKSARAARAWGAGVNWYLNRYAKLVFDYEQTRFDGGAAAGGNRQTEKAFLNRLQVAF